MSSTVSTCSFTCNNLFYFYFAQAHILKSKNSKKKLCVHTHYFPFNEDLVWEIDKQGETTHNVLCPCFAFIIFNLPLSVAVFLSLDVKVPAFFLCICMFTNVTNRVCSLTNKWFNYIDFQDEILIIIDQCMCALSWNAHFKKCRVCERVNIHSAIPQSQPPTDQSVVHSTNFRSNVFVLFAWHH